MGSPKTYSDIDWNLLWQNARDRKSWTGKTAADWDKKATSFAKRNTASPYVSLFLSHLPLEPSYSVLDVGSGPGTLTIPIASKVRSVTAVDYSQVMLEILTNRYREQGLANVSTVHGSWEDDWPTLGLGQYDCTIASRSMGVANLAEAIRKLNNHSKKLIVITDRIAPSPFDPAAFKAIGRTFESGPDYIYTINTLYSMGIHPNINILELEQDQFFSSFAEALESYTWMFKDLTAKEESSLSAYLQSQMISSTDDGFTMRRPFPPKWAMIWWEKVGLV